MRDLNDGELVEHLRSREPDALGALYDRYGQIVYSLFLRAARDTGTAEDLVQELFLRVWNHAHYFDPQKGSLAVWILSIARNMAIDHARSAGARFSARLRPMDEVEHYTEDSRTGNPDSAMDDVRTVQAAFSYLNEKQKQVLELAYFQGLSQSEIAAKLKEPLGTVKSWMRSGLLRMREAIKSGGVK